MQIFGRPAHDHVLAVSFGALVMMPVPLAGQMTGVDEAVLHAGNAIFEESCAICHMETGQGDPPHFPALAGNDNLADIPLIIGNIYEGRGNMPPFPDLSEDEIIAVATYIRNTWGNGFGEVPRAPVTALLSDYEEFGPRISVWDGVYTQAQADRGAELYLGPCGLCHGRRLDGAPTDPDMNSTPPIARAKFLRDWDGRSLATLYEYTRGTMPLSNPGFMSDQGYADVIAYMLSVTGTPVGGDELGTDLRALSRIIILQPE